MDILTIKGIQFRGLHGVHKHEKEQGNDFEVDVIFKADLSKPGKSDRLSDAIDYVTVHKIAQTVLEGPSKDLIEHLCHEIGTKIASSFPNVPSFDVAIRKLNPPLDSPTQYTEARLSWPR